MQGEFTHACLLRLNKVTKYILCYIFYFLRALCKLLCGCALVQVCLIIPHQMLMLSFTATFEGFWWWIAWNLVSHDPWNSINLKPVFIGLLKLLNLVTEAACEIPSFDSVAVWRHPSHTLCSMFSFKHWKLYLNVVFIAIEKSHVREP